MSPSINDNLTYFPVQMPFISFSHLIAVTKTSSTVLNKSSKSGHLCVLLDLRNKAFSISPLSTMLAFALL